MRSFQGFLFVGMALFGMKGEFVPAMGDCPANSLFAQAVRRSGVDVSNPQVEDSIEQSGDGPIVRQGMTWKGVAWAFTTLTASNWHPLTWLSHMLDCQAFGERAGLHHAVNVLLHVANTYLVFDVGLKIIGGPLPAFSAADPAGPWSARGKSEGL